MSDIFLKCPASCNATVSHSSVREPTLVSTWLYSQVLTNVSTWCTLNLAWGRCTWTTRCNYRPELYPLPWSQTWRGTVAGTWGSYHQLTFLWRYIKVPPWRPLGRKISWESGGIFPASAVSDTRLLAHDGTFGQAPGFHGLRKELGGRSPQIGTDRVSVTSAKTYFFPQRLGKNGIRIINYLCNHGEKT